ncbi:response regulator transcription factor [Enterococcus rivorum]|uniref:response regulator transcription factor n=1 Tax=Enterococcus rivorum TaxID=762845 RepID=UPI0036425689
MKPDVFFVDINMTGMNGLDLIQLLKKQFPQAIMVVISGYDDFEYARQAIQLQVFDYLLKPVPKSDFYLLLQKIDTCLKKQQQQTTTSQKKQTAHLSPIIADVTTYLENHYQDASLSGVKVATIFHINHTYLSKRMKQELGLSFIDYLTQLRIEKAIELLDDTMLNIKINDLSKKVGYQNPYYFSRLFKQRIGVSPLYYKQEKEL